MPESKTFEIATSAYEDEPVEFTLTWKEEDGSLGKADFVAHPKRISPVAILRVGSMKGAQDLFPLFHVFELALDDFDYQRFMTACDDSSHMVPIETLFEIFQYLVERGTSFPTAPSGS
jgi:hypothetical protein